MAANGNPSAARSRAARSSPARSKELNDLPCKVRPRWMSPTHQLLDWNDLPEWQKEDNSFVESGYRVAAPSFLKCMGSWRYLHNESSKGGFLLHPRNTNSPASQSTFTPTWYLVCCFICSPASLPQSWKDAMP